MAGLRACRCSRPGDASGVPGFNSHIVEFPPSGALGECIECAADFGHRDTDRAVRHTETDVGDEGRQELVMERAVRSGIECGLLIEDHLHRLCIEVLAGFPIS